MREEGTGQPEALGIVKPEAVSTEAPAYSRTARENPAYGER